MKAIVVLSGGLDSTVSLAKARQKHRVTMCLTFGYGQRAEAREYRAARRIAAYYGISFRFIRLNWLAAITSTALVARRSSLPKLTERQLADSARTRKTAKAVWVPNRNGVFINIAAAVAEAARCDLLVTGFNREEAQTFPDNSPAYVQAANRALRYSTANHVRVVSFTERLDKPAIVKTGLRLKAPLSLTWSCYEGGHLPCRRCESCLRSMRAYRAAGCNYPLP